MRENGGMSANGQWEQARPERERMAHWLAVSYRAMREARLAVERGEPDANERYRRAMLDADVAVAASERLLAVLPQPSDVS